MSTSLMLIVFISFAYFIITGVISSYLESKSSLSGMFSVEAFLFGFVILPIVAGAELIQYVYKKLGLEQTDADADDSIKASSMLIAYVFFALLLPLGFNYLNPPQAHPEKVKMTCACPSENKLAFWSDFTKN